MTTAMLGGEVFVPTLDGEATIEVPAGTQHGDVDVLDDEGLPPLHGGRRGDQHVVFELVVPTGLSGERGSGAAGRAATITRRSPSARLRSPRISRRR